MLRTLFSLGVLLGILFGGALLQARAEVIPLTQSGAALKTIRIPTTASADLQATAGTLAGYLNQMTGATFTVATFDPAVGPDPGIVLALSTNVNLTDEVPAPGTNMKIRERYIISTSNTTGYVFLVGATDVAIRDAAYDWLERMQCRWYFASPNWELIPFTPNLSWTTPSVLRTKATFTMGTKSITGMNIYADELPDYKMRSIWAEYCNSGGGNGEWVQQYNDWQNWSKRNRAVSSYAINAGHAYDAIISWATARGRWSNDYYALIDGVRATTGQFCLSNPAVQQVIIDYAVDKFNVTPTLESVSLEPRDGSSWCQCDPCRAMQDERNPPTGTGFVTDRVVTVNNLAANAIPDGKYIGMYAYNKHSDGPSMSVNDQMYVLIATAFLSQGNTVDSLLADWSAKADNLGIRDYFSVFDWDFCLPGKARVANLTYVNTKLPYYFINNADVMSAESTHAWGPLGLGFYLAAKKLWNTDADIAALQSDFFTRCFGPASGTMTEFYARLDPNNRYPLSDDLMGRLYGYLMTARGQTTDPGIVARLDDLTLFLNYVDLYRQYGLSEQVLRFVWRIRNTNMVDSLTIWRNFAGTWPDGKNWQVHYPDHPWKDNYVYTHDEIVQMNEDGILNNPLLPEEPRSFSDDLVPSGVTGTTRGGMGRTRGRIYYVLRANSSGVLPTLSVADGFIYSNQGDAHWYLYTNDGQTLLESGTIPPDRVVRNITFSTTGQGNYIFEYYDVTSGSTVTWPAGSMVSICAGPGRTLWQSGRASRLYFYVPKGTQYVEAYASSLSDCNFYRADGTLKQSYTTNQSNLDIVIPVNAGDDDQIWYVTQMQAVGFQFRNIPGFVALRQDELLIPREAYANLVPSGMAAGTRGFTGGLRDKNYFYLRTKTDGSLPPLTINDGAIYTNRGDLVWTLYTEDGATQLQTGTVPPDRTNHVVTFTNPATPGTYLVKTDDNMAGYSVTWATGDDVSISATQDRPFTNRTRAGRLYFFVPKGTTLITFTATSCSDCNFYNGAGALAYAFAGGTTGSVPVPAGQDGQVWFVNSASTKGFRFLNIPGVMALNKDELLLPHWALTE